MFRSVVQCAAIVLCLLPSTTYSDTQSSGTSCSQRCTSTVDYIVDRAVGASFTFSPCEGACTLCKSLSNIPVIQAVTDAGQVCNNQEVKCQHGTKNLSLQIAAGNGVGDKSIEPGKYQWELEVELHCICIAGPLFCKDYTKTNFLVPVQLRVFEVSLISYGSQGTAAGAESKEEPIKLMCTVDGPIPSGSDVMMYFSWNSTVVNCSKEATSHTAVQHTDHDKGISTRRINRRCCELEINSQQSVSGVSCGVAVRADQETFMLSSPNVDSVNASAPPTPSPNTEDSGSTLLILGFGLSGFLLVVLLVLLVTFLASWGYRYRIRPDDDEHRRLLPQDSNANSLTSSTRLPDGGESDGAQV